jgi:anaerobic selenocysteine-containing dehydrogenase
VTGARIVSGLIPANSIADEILTDQPERFRAMWIESSNPAHSLPESPRFRRALESLELVVVVDVAMTETARCADYVLPAASQFEKWEATLFNVEFPENVHHVRAPLLEPAPGTRPEPDIHADIIRALGVVDEGLLERLRETAAADRATFTVLFFSLLTARPELQGLTPYLLHRTLGQTLPDGSAATATTWAMATMAAIGQPEAVRRAGFDGPLHRVGDKLFDALLRESSGVVFTRDDYADAWNYVRHPDRRIHVEIPVLLDELRSLRHARSQWTSDEFPFVLAAGERREHTANTIFRDPTWRTRDAGGALRINPEDAEALGVRTGDAVRIITSTGQAHATIEISDTLRRGHVTLPNGMGLESTDESGALSRAGVPLNELTSSQLRDPFLGTPWHKHVPARIEVIA